MASLMKESIQEIQTLCPDKLRQLRASVLFKKDGPPVVCVTAPV